MIQLPLCLVILPVRASIIIGRFDVVRLWFRREAARRFGIDARTVAKMVSFSVPPGYRRSRPAVRPKLDPFVGMIDRILEEDKGRPAKQRHTSKRIFQRLRDEHDYGGGLTIAKDYVLAQRQRQRQREVFVPLRHDPGHAQADFGETLAVIGGVERKVHFFAMDLPHSDAGFVQAYPACQRRRESAHRRRVFVAPSWIIGGQRLARAGRVREGADGEVVVTASRRFRWSTMAAW